MISFISSTSANSNYPYSNNEIVFVGKSNVGKSSLINSLYGKIAYVGKTPGKTRLLNFFNVDNKYTVCDVPGYGYAKISNNEKVNFGKLMEKYFADRDVLKLCVFIMDIRRIPNEDDKDMIEFLRSRKIKFVFVLNKSDKLSNNEINNQLKKIKMEIDIKEDIFITSTLKRKNIKELKEYIEDSIVNEKENY